ncbi:MAG: bifunctional DNA primase/polymerase [Acidobacteriia bacterium]|nr:bifunctional DNA primase/polymerase [Terriglobia bacterium]
MSRPITDESPPGKIPAELLFLVEQELPVFPLIGVTKQPHKKGWQQSASRNVKEIARWHAHYPGCNWAVAIPNDVIVLDLDGPEGLATLAVLEKQFGPFETLQVATGGNHGGEHIYFRAPGHRLKNGPNGLKDTPGLELKVHGGLVVVPPSCVVKPYAYLKQVPIAPAPHELLDFLAQGRNGDRIEQQSQVPTIDGPIPEGQRDNTLTSLAGTMRRRGMSKEAILAALLEENKRCDPPLPGTQVEKIARSVARYEPDLTGLLMHRTDLGNAKFFTDQHRDVIRYSPGQGYFCYDGRRWVRGNEDLCLCLGRESVSAMYELAIKLTDNDQRAKLLRHALAAENRERLLAMIRLARSEEGIIVESDVWNRNPWLLNVANGTLDLRRDSFGLHEHRPEDFITKITPVAYDPVAPCPRWHQFLARILPDASKREYLQRFAGYALTADVSEQCLLLSQGGGANGKTTFHNVLYRLLGEYALKASFDTFLYKRFPGIRNDLARLAGVRVVIATEGPEGQRLDESLVKELTGGDPITARFLYHESFTFDFAGKILLSTNYRPRIDDTSHAMWRRIRLIEFNVQIPEREQDKHLLEKLLAELPGILNWAIEGCLNWQEKALEPPEVVTQATLDYQSESDVLAEFIEDRCVIHETARVAAKRLYAEYQDWARARELRWTLSKPDFNTRLRAKFKSTKPQNALTWHGIGVRAPEIDQQKETGPDEL